ncbi:MAG: TIGR03936 family radical SAM-associated protein [Clostridia bacterium]|nr:TIGR03936 family radical SAM-associated protein [Clostridia bacterium]
MSQETRFIYRVKYTKGEKVKYISHLDFLRCVNRSFKRGKIPVKYSNGFNPHVLLNIALPCPVGVSSVCELLDIELYEPMATNEIKERLNKALPVGIEALEVTERGEQKDFFDISSALYEIEFKSQKEIDLAKFIAEPEFIIEKKSKRGMKEVNIKDFVHSIDIKEAKENVYKINTVIDAGAKSNLKSELLLGAMEKYFDVAFYDIHTQRKEIYFD